MGNSTYRRVSPTELRFYHPGGLCDINRSGPDQAEMLSEAIKVDPKMKRAFTPERAEIAWWIDFGRRKGKIPDVTQYIDKYNTERYRYKGTGRFVSEETAIQILSEQSK